MYYQLAEKLDTPIELRRVKTTNEWLDVLSESFFLISGRFHHSLAAFMLDTPFVAFPTDTHKLKSALEMLHCQDLLIEPNIKEKDLIERVSGILNKMTVASIAEKAQICELSERNFEGVRAFCKA